MEADSSSGSAPSDKTTEAERTTRRRARLLRTPRGIENWRFLVYVADRFMHDSCQQRAAALTFTSLLAVVPMLAVSFAIFAAFPAYARMRDQVQAFLFNNLVPHVGETLHTYLESFTAQTGKLTTVGVIFLALSAVMLMVSVSNTFNQIWRVRQTRSVISRMVTFWAMITLMPLLFGASLSISSYLFATSETAGGPQPSEFLSNVGFLVPFVLQTIGFSAVFLLMPNYPVRRSDALIGGLVASTLFELLKEGFGLYITSFPTYQTIYGAMATIPIFLVWVYLVWIVVLLSAEMTAAIPEWQAGTRRIRRRDLAPLARMLAALGILASLRERAVDGGGLSPRRLMVNTGLRPDDLAEAAEFLKKHKYIARGEKRDWLLSRDLSTVTVYDLYTDLDLGFDHPIRVRLLKMAWGRRFSELKEDLDGLSRETMAMTLEELLAPASQGELHAINGDDDFDEDDQEDSKKERRHGRARILALLGIGAVSAGS
ncbi:MAG: YihY family inner membrane protein [Alphaproteobacteria bacterium]